MPEINLPTKAGQDLIKADTTSLLARAGGTNFLNQTSIYSTGTTPIVSSDGTKIALNVAGQGIIYFWDYTNSNGNVSTKLKIDGVVIPLELKLAQFFTFKESIIIEVSSNSSTGYTSIFKIVYGLM